jgi:murein L,D-transpeptidase YcbB/YkuD
MFADLITSRTLKLSTCCASLFALLAFGSFGCSSGSELQPLGAEEDLDRNHNQDLVDAVDQQLPELLEAEAKSRASQTGIRAILERGEQARVFDHPVRYPELLAELYAARDYNAAWLESEPGGGASSAAGELRELFVSGVERHGLWRDELRIHTLESIDLTLAENKRDIGDKTVMLDSYEREALMTWLSDSETTYSTDEGLHDLVSDALADGGPLSRFEPRVTDRVDGLQASSERRSEFDILVSDTALHWTMRMRFENDAWLRDRTWPERLQDPPETEDGDSDASETANAADAGEADAGDSVGESASPRLTGDALVEARRRYAVLETLRPVFETPDKARSVLESVIPPYRQYERLTKAFARYEAIVRDGGWPQLPDAAEELRAGDESEHVTTLKERLRIEGYWDGDDSETFTRELRRALIDYQATHQLWVNGWLTPQTMDSLNVPAIERWHQIRLSLQRWRESRIGPDEYYVHVNVPDFHAEVWNHGTRDLRFKVVAGATKRKRDEKTGDVRYTHATPQFSATLEYVVFNPYWNVPPSIRKKELQPKLEENPDYYEEKNYEVVVDDNGYEFVRQKPGPENALGRVKFLFPNKHSVYLHDTPDKHLFDHPFRAYSHGCVRIQDPMNFAHYLLDLDGRLSDEERREEKLEEWYAKESETWFKLRHPLPIHLEYFVVRVDDDGHANFLADLYRLDRPREETIRERVAELYPELVDDSQADDGEEMSEPAQEEAEDVEAIGP